MDEHQKAWLNNEVDHCAMNQLMRRLLRWAEARDPGLLATWADELVAHEPPDVPRALDGGYIERAAWSAQIYELNRLLGREV